MADRLSISVPDACAVIGELHRLGYIDTAPGKTGWWETTLKGSSLALASAARPVRRAVAEQKLEEFLGRVHEVNGNPYFLYRVRRVLLFGSLLTGSERVNDVDLALDLVPKEEDAEKRMALEEERVAAAREAGRQFANYVAELFWPLSEVMLFLKARSRTLSLHTTGDRILESTPYQVLFEEGGASGGAGDARRPAGRPVTDAARTNEPSEEPPPRG